MTRNPLSTRKLTTRSAARDGRCEFCQLRLTLCVCAIVPKMELSTRLVVLMHARELNLTTNTAKLARVALSNSEIRIRGQKDRPMSGDGILSADRQSLFLFPSAEAVTLTPELVASYAKPITLIVPDGSWRQAKRVGRREPVLAGVPHVKLPPGELSTYRLRREPNAESVSTFEAIARALGIIEGREVQERMEHLFDVMVERLLWLRGLLPREQCRYPIPQAAVDEFYIAGCKGTIRREETEE